MWSKENDTYIGKYWKNSEIIPIRKELLAEWCIENLSIFFAEQVLETISNKAIHGIWIGKENEKFIQESLQHIWRKLTPNLIEQYTWWVPCVENEIDLLDEYANNNTLYTWLLIEAKICLQELKQYKNGNIQWNAEDLLHWGRYEEHYSNIIHHMNKIITINNSIKIHLDPPDLA